MAKMRYYKNLLNSILIISIIFFCGNIFGAQDNTYLKKYFENAIYLYESSKYKEAILLFQKIIEAEKTEGKFYFTPFAEIYIDKSRDKDKTLMPGTRIVAQEEEPTYIWEQDGEDVAKREVNKANKKDNYDNIVNYYENKHKKPIIATPEDRISKDIGMESAKNNAPPKTPQIIEPKKKEKTVVSMNTPPGDLLNEELDQDLENLDEETLKSFDDERFVDIVKRIKQYKKHKK